MVVDLSHAKDDLNACLNAIDTKVQGLDKPDELVRLWQDLGEISKGIAILKDEVANKAGENLGAYKTELPGVGVVIRRRNKRRTKWQTDDLLRAVLDSHVVDTETGEIKDPTPVDKIKHVWNLGTPRTTALKERGLDPDEWCETEDRGWGIEIK